jgi:GTP cyclohydrolase II
LAGFEPAGCSVEILNEDGTMARLPDLVKVAEKFDMKIVSIADLIEYRLKHESLIERLIDVQLPTKYGDFEMVAFKQVSNQLEHLAIIKGTWEQDEPILVRVHSSCMTGDIFGSCRCDCGEQLEAAMTLIENEGKGVIVYMNQEGRGIGLLNKLKAYKLQESGMDTVEANLSLGFQMDERDYGVGAQILRNLGVTKMRLMSNNPKKRKGLIGYGLEIVDNVSLKTGGVDVPTLYNGDMETALGGHSFFTDTGGSAKVTSEGLSVVVPLLGGAPHTPHYYYMIPTLAAGTYQVKIALTSSVARDLRFNIILPDASYISILADGFIDQAVTTNGVQYFTATVVLPTALTNVKVELDFGTLGGTKTSLPGTFVIQEVLLYRNFNA